MSRLSSMVERYQILTFFVLTYALAWTLESPLVFLRDTITDTQGLVLTILASNVPSVLGIGSRPSSRAGELYANCQVGS